MSASPGVSLPLRTVGDSKEEEGRGIEQKLPALGIKNGVFTITFQGSPDANSAGAPPLRQRPTLPTPFVPLPDFLIVFIIILNDLILQL